MKTLIVIVLILFLVACDLENDNHPRYIEGTSKQYNDFSKDSGFKIRYFKDKRTKLCFAERGVGYSYTFTCVPCDSLVIRQIEKFEDFE